MYNVMLPTASSQGIGKTGEFLSIMIPNYNNGHYLGDTLRSLLAVGSKIADAQIEVLDNCSTDNSEQVVHEVGQGKIKWTQHKENIGSHANHNACYKQATRTWVHILHSDDIMFPAAYEEFDACLQEAQNQQSQGNTKEIDAVFARCVWGNAQAIWQGTSLLMGSGVRGYLNYHPATWAVCPVHFLSTMVRREAALALGGYDAKYKAMTDWNFCWRLNRERAAAYSNVCVGFYRLSETGDTASQTQSGNFCRDGLRQINRLVETVCEDQAEAALPSYGAVNCDRLFDPFFDFVVGQCYHFIGNWPIFDIHVQVLQEFPRNRSRQAKILRLRLVRQKNKMNKIRTRRG